MKIDSYKKELQQSEVNDLVAKSDALRRELFSLSINISTTHVKDYSQFKKLRKNIARSLTYLRQKKSI